MDYLQPSLCKSVENPALQEEKLSSSHAGKNLREVYLYYVRINGGPRQSHLYEACADFKNGKASILTYFSQKDGREERREDSFQETDENDILKENAIQE